MEEYMLRPETCKTLLRKLLVICPVCKKPIYGKDLNLERIFQTEIIQWPLSYIHCHSNGSFPIHALTIYIDDEFNVRAHEVSDFLEIDN